MTDYSDPAIPLTAHLEQMLTPIAREHVALSLPDILTPNANTAVKAAVWCGLLDRGLVDELMAAVDDIKRDLLDGTTAVGEVA